MQRARRVGGFSDGWVMASDIIFMFILETTDLNIRQPRSL